MDWDFIIAMAIVALSGLWLLLRLVRNAKRMKDVIQDKADIHDLCKNCPLHDQCNMPPTAKDRYPGPTKH